MKTSAARSLPVLAAAGVALLAGCYEPPRQAVLPPPAVPPVAAAREPETIVRPDPSAADVSAPVAEIARLHQSGLDESVVKAFVEKSTNALGPSADELIFLKDIGVSPRVITAMIQQTARMREQAAALAARPAAPAEVRPSLTVIAASANPPAAPPAAPAPAVATAPQPPAAVAPAPVPQVAAPPAAPPPPANLPPQVTVFYQQLQPYGTWMQIADHGWCWQPSVVVSTPTWRPYTDRGRWLYTDCGWYWQSDYAWGWAPFHYGRWVLHARSGWLWVPDTTWGPAWVVWRSSASHCGWAPLPPGAAFIAGSGVHFGGVRVGLNFGFGLARHHYTFIPFTRFCDRNPHYFALPPTVVQNVFNQTTVINNIQVNNHVVVNNGIPAERVASLTRSEIRKVSVREAAPQPQAFARLDRLEKAGDDLVIYRPALNPNAPVKPMTLTNHKGETRTELVPAGTLAGQKIAGRPVYDTTSTGVPVLTGYTTEPPVRATGGNVVVINNTVNPTPPPAPVIATTPAAPAGSAPDNSTPPNRAGRIFGISPSNPVAKRAEEAATRQATVIIPNPANNSLFRPLTPPPPVTSTPRSLTPPTPVGPSQPAYVRREVPKPQSTPATVAPSPAKLPVPSAPATRTTTVIQPSAPFAPVVPARPTLPSYQPAAPRPTVTIPAPAVPVAPPPPAAARPIVIVSPPPQPSSAPASPGNPGKSTQEKRR